MLEQFLDRFSKFTVLISSKKKNKIKKQEKKPPHLIIIYQLPDYMHIKCLHKEGIFILEIVIFNLIRVSIYIYFCRLILDLTKLLSKVLITSTYGKVSLWCDLSEESSLWISQNGIITLCINDKVTTKLIRQGNNPLSF